eukprot:2890538-Amphidinium_carterae.1
MSPWALVHASAFTSFCATSRSTGYRSATVGAQSGVTNAAQPAAPAPALVRQPMPRSALGSRSVSMHTKRVYIKEPATATEAQPAQGPAPMVEDGEPVSTSTGTSTYYGRSASAGRQDSEPPHVTGTGGAGLQRATIN